MPPVYNSGGDDSCSMILQLSMLRDSAVLRDLAVSDIAIIDFRGEIGYDCTTSGDSEKKGNVDK